MRKIIMSVLLLMIPLACSKDEEEVLPSGIDESLLGTGASRAWRSVAPKDTTAAPLPGVFVASTALGYGAVQLIVAYPEFTEDYDLLCVETPTVKPTALSATTELRPKQYPSLEGYTLQNLEATTP